MNAFVVTMRRDLNIDIEDVWGIIPQFLDGNDERSCREQFNEHYQGGWQNSAAVVEGLNYDKERKVLTFPGDPDQKWLSTIFFRDEQIHMFESEWVVVEQKDGSWEVCRMD